MDLAQYSAQPELFDELLTPQGRARPGSAKLAQFLRRASSGQLSLKRESADLAIKTLGISFTIYSEGKNIDRQWPFDLVPRLIRDSEWKIIELGLKQRLKALNLFITDVYNEQLIIKDGVIPDDIISTSKDFRSECVGMRPKFGRISAAPTSSEIGTGPSTSLKITYGSLQASPTCWRTEISASVFFRNCWIGITFSQWTIIHPSYSTRSVLSHRDRLNGQRLSF